MAEFDGDKQHDATPHRREQAREEGQIARSQDLGSAVLLLAGLIMLWYWGGDLATYFGRLFREQLGGEAWIQIDSATTVERWIALMINLSWAVVPLLGVILLAAIGVNLAQVGFLFLPNKVGLNAAHINPLQNAQRLFSLGTIVRLAFGLFKIAVISLIAAMGIWNEHEQLMSLGELEGPQVAVYLTQVTLTICIQIAAALVVLALIDYGYQYWKQESDLKMTTQELREELKDQQGNPQILGKRKQIQRQMANSRLKIAVPKADVVVTNPTELAIAIQYDFDTMPAPVVLAKGAGVLAQQIRRLALEKGIAIVERKELAQVLYKTADVGQQIPVEQYAAVAEVLRYVYQLQGRKLPTLAPSAAT
jgi:flagellar biosynthesis protein FlhB